MAEVALKTNICTKLCNGNTGIHHSHPQPHGVSVFPNKSAAFSCASAFPTIKLRSSPLKSNFSSSSTDFYGRGLLLGGKQAKPRTRNPQSGTSNAQMSIGIGKAQRWWEKGLQPNMKEITGAQDLVDSLSNAGDKLVVVDFFSPGCGGCKAVHPKICQLAETNPNVQFLQVNYEEHKSMCYTLNVHVLPFFRFFRGADGRVCSFSCTNATIKKFKDALAKYGADRSSLGPAKGLEEKELLALAANRDLSFSYKPKSEPPASVSSQEEIITKTVEVSPHVNLGPPLPLPRPLSTTASSPSSGSAAGTENAEKESLIPSGR